MVVEAVLSLSVRVACACKDKFPRQGELAVHSINLFAIEQNFQFHHFDIK